MLDLGRTFLQSVERSPTALAIIDGDIRLTYAEWFDKVCHVAGGLAGLGLGRGDHLLVVLQNRWEMATLHWACQFLGVVDTPLNWRAKPDEVEYCAVDSGAKAIVFEAVSADAIAGSPRAQQMARILVGQAEAVQTDPSTQANPPTLSFDDLLIAPPLDREDPPLAAGPEDISLMLYTSGTTGKPKGVPRRHRQERAAALAHVAQNSYRRGERTLGVMPLYHTMGVRSLLSMAMVDGLFVCVPRYDSAAVLRLIASERITNLYLVPTLYHDMLAHPTFAQTDVTSVTKIGFAGAPMHDALLKRIDAAFKPELFVNHYGSSEVYTCTINQDAVAKPGCAGRAGINTRIGVVPLDAVAPHPRIAAGQEGQIIADLAGDEAFDGYWNRPDADAKSLRGGWYFTGDTGYVDADGDLFVTGRVDDMIISGGENISPVDIESVLSLHPGVDEVAVAGLPDERWGQRVVAFVKRHRHADTAIDSAVLDAWCRTSDLVNFKRPRDYVFVQAIPKSPVGKVLRRCLVAGDYEPEHPLSKEQDSV
ncbi:4-chlorobenzoate--CoA ligase [Pigmentiphaga litoralis]|uniref:AMP-binding protein n=1 Tax=Pigmentiphaga litoralis TaxID=516702 RepID=UPI0016748B33|nr:AMP-binding protein [Pigmentiphaga litoralis]GGX08032.1 4-chlorobenzoate--CoA ligase [Pigmentiphaga litoralis]